MRLLIGRNDTNRHGISITRLMTQWTLLLLRYRRAFHTIVITLFTVSVQLSVLGCQTTRVNKSAVVHHI